MQVVGGWPNVPHPPPSQMTATVVYSGPGGQDRVLGIARESPFGFVAWVFVDGLMDRSIDGHGGGIVTSSPQNTAGIPTQRYWTVEQPVAEPTGEGRYHW